MQYAHKIENEVDLSPVVDTAIIFGDGGIALCAVEVTVSRSNEGCGEYDELAGQSERPDDQMDNIGAFSPIKQGEQDVQIEEGRPG